jgi:hypothetical protein
MKLDRVAGALLIACLAAVADVSLFWLGVIDGLVAGFFSLLVLFGIVYVIGRWWPNR